MDEIKLGQAQHRGIRAEELLNNSLLQEAFRDIEAEFLKAWRSTKARDTDARERLWQAIHCLGIVHETLKRHVTDGRIAAEDLRRLSRESKAK